MALTIHKLNYYFSAKKLNGYNRSSMILANFPNSGIWGIGLFKSPTTLFPLCLDNTNA